MMRKDYELFNQQLGILDKEEAEVFGQFLRKEKCIADIAEDKGLVYESVQQKLHRVKRKVKIQMVGFLDGNVGGVCDAKDENESTAFRSSGSEWKQKIC